MPNIEIRKSIVSDFEPIRNLLIICFGERKENDFGLFEAVTSGKFMVLTIDDKVTATLSITPTASDLYVEGSASLLSCVCTHPDYQRQGLMKELLSEALQKMWTDDNLVVWAVREPNQPKANLHKLLSDFGFEKKAGKEKSWTIGYCREAYGFKCHYKHATHTSNCCCHDELWVKTRDL